MIPFNLSKSRMLFYIFSSFFLFNFYPIITYFMTEWYFFLFIVYCLYTIICLYKIIISILIPHATNYATESFPVRSWRSYSSGGSACAWARPHALLADVQKVLRHARKLPDKTQHLFKVKSLKWNIDNNYIIGQWSDVWIFEVLISPLYYNTYFFILGIKPTSTSSYFTRLLGTAHSDRERIRTWMHGIATVCTFRMRAATSACCERLARP